MNKFSIMKELSKIKVSVAEPIDENTMLRVLGGAGDGVDPIEPVKMEGCIVPEIKILNCDKCDKCDKCSKCGLVCTG